MNVANITDAAINQGLKLGCQPALEKFVGLDGLATGFAFGPAPMAASLI
jgi:hypothetical protein